MKTKVLLKKLAKFFPKSLAESYDHVGLQCGKIKEETNKILLCLDYDEDVYQYIVDNNLDKEIDLIISHHPFIFGTRALAKKLGLIDIKRLETEPMARGGTLPNEMEIHDFSKYAEDKFNVNYGLLLNYGTTKIKKVALIGGGGWRSFINSKQEGYDIFISGDIPHHGRRAVVQNRYNYLDLPHEIEKIFMEQFKEVLLSINSELQVLTVDQEVLPECLCI